MTLMQALLAKQKLDEEKAARRLELRRGYAKAGRERRKRAKALAETGLLDLPPEVQAQIKLTSETPAPAVEPPKIADATVEELVTRLMSIRERIFRLSAMFAVSLSWDCAVEANKFLTIFQALAAELKEKDESALEQITRGHEAVLLSPTIPVKQTIPIETQRLAELQWEVNRTPARREPTPSTVSDGLDWLVG